MEKDINFEIAILILSIIESAWLEVTLEK